MLPVQTTAPEAQPAPSARPLPPSSQPGRLHDLLGDPLRAPGALGHGLSHGLSHGPSHAAFEQALQRAGRAGLGGRGGPGVPGDGETPLPEAAAAPAPLQPAAAPVAVAPAGQVRVPDAVSTLLHRQGLAVSVADTAAATHWQLQLQLPPLQPGRGAAPQVQLQRLPDGHLHLVLQAAADQQRPGPLAALRERLAARGHGLDSVAAAHPLARQRDDHPPEEAP